MYWADYLADTTHLSTFQHGAYLLLIAAYWRKGGPIPANSEYVASVCRTTPDKVARWLPPVVAMFATNEGLLIHKRIDFEILRPSTRQAAAVANGMAGGLAKAKLSTTTATTTKKKEEVDRVPQKADAPKRKARSQIPPDFPSQEGLEQARQYWAVHARFDLVDELTTQAEQFRDHHVKTGATMADWNAAWRTWYRNALKFNRKANGNGRESAHEKLARVTADVIREGRDRRRNNGVDERLEPELSPPDDERGPITGLAADVLPRFGGTH